jgi:quercetin dioxygenase-like cupin family protein
MEAVMATPVVRPAGDGERYWFYGGGVHVWKVTDRQTDGAFFAFEDELAKGKTTPYHVHPDATESVYVLSGEILVNIDGDEHVVGEGGFTMTPPGTPHAFVVTSEKARILALQVPGAGAAFYLGASEPATPELEAAAPVDFDRVTASATTNGGMRVLGPPPFAR